MTYWRQQQDRQTIDKPTNITNNRLTDIWLSKDGLKRTNHVLQSSQPITSRLDWQTTNNITSSSTNQDKDQRLITSTDDSQFTWLWWWLEWLRLSKRQCHLKQSFSGLHSPARSWFTELWLKHLLPGDRSQMSRSCPASHSCHMFCCISYHSDYQNLCISQFQARYPPPPGQPPGIWPPFLPKWWGIWHEQKPGPSGIWPSTKCWSAVLFSVFYSSQPWM